ncbi:MAG: oxygenase MpaB family protein, partial [Bacteroidetes bacterium]|nr:oxygenase MpaB family protein [Bacteroidota bacterium]
WLNYESFRPAGRAVYKNASLVLAAFVAGVLVEGFSTMIAKSFRMTGRVGSKNTKRRLGYNARHILEIFYPGGMLRPNDGWKMTMRIRFVHAKVRYLLNRFDEWDKEAWGCPVSAAHLGYATAVFSMRLIHFSKILGVKFNREEQEGVMDVFRYVGYLFGVPDAILYEDKKAAERIFKIGMLCEPSPDEDSAFMANQLVRAVPSVTGIENVKEAEEQVKLGYALSGILIGRKMAKDLQFPYYNGFIALFLFRTRIFLESVLKDTQFVRRKNFMELLGISSYDDIIGISYKLPTHVKDAMSQDW